MTIDQYRVSDMSCQHCVAAISREVGAVAGVARVDVDLTSKSVRVEHDASVAGGTIEAAIRRAGFDEIAALA
ncbi:MAG: heavy-metal-associated domain-containing protein [Chloroflexi bacterium]|nr:heavy-metal-associated domain-containing protein [Chloroflexota bacterium]